MSEDSTTSSPSTESAATSSSSSTESPSTGSSMIKRLLGFIFLFYLSFGIINPVNIELFEKINSVGSDGKHSKHSASLYGALFALPGLIFFFVSPIIGNLSDRLGRKLFLTLFAFCYTLTFGIYYLLCHVVITPDEDLSDIFKLVKYNGLKFYIAAKIIQGCSLDIIPLCNSFIADHSKKEDFATYFSFILAAMGLATAIGPMLSGFVVKNFGMAQVFQLIFLTSGITTLFVAKFVKENAKDHIIQQDSSLIEKVTTPFKSLYNILTRGDSVLNSLIVSKLLSSFISVGFFCIVTQFTRIKYSFGPTENGYVLTLIGITAILSNSVLSKLIMYLSKGKETNGLIISGLANALFFFAFVVCGNGAYVYYGTVFFLFGAKEDPLRSALISKVFNDPSQQGVLNGCLGSISTVGRVVSPIIFSSLLDIFTTSEVMPRIVDAPFIALSVMQLICVAFVVRAKYLIEKNKGE